jgi:glutamate/tyrosine decarboxylase-like PLP-dependent enzyme
MDELLDRGSALGREYLASLRERPVGEPIPPDELRAALGDRLADEGSDPVRVVEELAEAVEPGLVATAGPRYFGFVIGGSLPVTVATGWLAAAWDQNAGNYPSSPAIAVLEELAGEWLVDMFGLPAGANVGFVTGGTMANFTGLAAGRHAVLRDAGWDVEADGLFGAPPVNVVVGEEAHTTIFVSLRMLGPSMTRARCERTSCGRRLPN